MVSEATRQAARARREEILEEIEKNHLKELYPGSGKCMLISGMYPGVWLEHAYDGVAYADAVGQRAEVARHQIDLFLDGQREDGQFPFRVTAAGREYSHLQECVPFALVCDLALRRNGNAGLREVYEKLKQWDAWQARYHTDERGRLLTFCGWDTGHDHSRRLADFGIYETAATTEARDRPQQHAVLPLIMPDMNAVYYGDKRVLSEMAGRLGLPVEQARYAREAEALREEITATCYDAADDFYYDVDCHGNRRKIRSIGVTALFVSRFFEREEGRRVFSRYFRSPEYFGTPYPYPSIAVSDAAFEKNAPGNSWNYYAQGLTMLRSLLWMDDYGLSDDLEANMERWVTALTPRSAVPFGQELDPFTGAPSSASPYYSSSMIFYLAALRRLGI